ncbi:MAG TPA: TonB-dependent receptor, partial [Ignavibacteriaceae bacterium]|nr:TonB-dependent receptor [Ignavibacteriaceae bacterium]
MNKLILSLSLLLFANLLFSQKKELSVSGFVTDSKTGEALLGSNILLYKDSLDINGNPLRGTASNNFGFYVLPNLSPARYIIVFRHIGYKPVLIDSTLDDKNAMHRINVALQPEEIQLEEVVVQGKKENKAGVSIVEMPPDIVNRLPSLSGEVDLLKSLEYIPGVKSASEISSGLYIRGGSPDQTLTLVDGMIFYNPAHLGNFTTTFNSSALQEIKLLKGAFPAEYGGRLSGVLDLKLRSGTKERDVESVGIGTLNSNLTLEGPMDSNSTYMLAGRGMYYDILQKNFIKDSEIPRYHFYDLNCKFSYTISGSDIVSISVLYSKDRLYNPPADEDIRYDINWENGGLNINWFEANSSSFISNTIVSYINYKFGSSVENNFSVTNSSDYFTLSKLQDFLLKKSFEFYLYEKHSIK